MLTYYVSDTFLTTTLQNWGLWKFKKLPEIHMVGNQQSGKFKSDPGNSKRRCLLLHQATQHRTLTPREHTSNEFKCLMLKKLLHASLGSIFPSFLSRGVLKDNNSTLLLPQILKLNMFTSSDVIELLSWLGVLKTNRPINQQNKISLKLIYSK